MIYRKLSSSGDYVFGNSQLDFYRNSPEAVAQSVKTRLQLWINEWFLNVEEGTPFLQGILGKHDKELADAAIQDRVLNTIGVTDIESYESTINPDTRFFQVQFTINTIYGPTSVEIENYGNY